MPANAKPPLVGGAGGRRGRLVVLVSGSGTNLQALLDAATDPAYPASVVAVGADRAGTGGGDRATDAGVPTFVVPVDDHPSRTLWDVALADAVALHRPDLVVTAGFMKILGSEMLRRYTVVNTHPALLPAFPGAHAVHDALAYGVRITGCTVHFVDAGVDTGPIVAQAAVPVLDDDDVETLHERIKAQERTLLVHVVARLVAGDWSIHGRKVTLS